LCYESKILTNYTTKNELIIMFVSVIYKDKKGELCFALNDGAVFMFNGKSFDKMY